MDERHARPGSGLRVRRWLLTMLLASALSACGASARPETGDSHAVILLYHHVADDTPPSTSVTPRMFAAHLRYLAEHDYHVMPLGRLVEALAGAAPLPERAVAITFDDAYRSVYTGAAPLLERHGFPFAVFVSTDYIDAGSAGYMSWAQLRELEDRGAEIGNHSRSHQHYLHRPPGESAAGWRRRVSGDIDSAQQRLTEELRRPLRVLAYPYGEFGPALTAIAAAHGYPAFGQHSGPVGPDSDRYALPRFPMAGTFAALESFTEKLRTRPFRATVLAPRNPVLAAGGPAPTLRLALAAPGARLDALSCFVTGQPPPAVTWVDREAGVVEITARAGLPVGRSKYTCTAPARDADGVFYWYSHLWMTPPASGEWYAD